MGPLNIGLLVITVYFIILFSTAFFQTNSVRVNAAQALVDCGQGKVQRVDQDGYRCFETPAGARR